MSVIRVTRKLWDIFSIHQKKKVVQLVILMFFAGILETCSVGLIVPFIDAIVNIDTIMNKWYVQLVCRVLGLNHSFTFLFVVSVSLGLLCILKNVFLLFEYNIQYRFVFRNLAMIQKRVLENMLGKPYEYFLGVNSGEIIRLVNTDVTNSFRLLQQLLLLYSELAVSVMLTGTIFIIAPGITMVIAAVLVVLLLFINMVIKPILRREGEKSLRASAEINKWLLQSIQGIKEIKVMGLEDFFFKQFSDNCDADAECLGRQTVLSYAPRFIIEAICMASLFFVIALLIVTGSRFGDILPLLSAIAMAAIRLLPSTNRISGALSTISFYEMALDNMISHLDGVSNDAETTVVASKSESLDMRVSESIRFENITYHYPNMERNVLYKASMTVNCGEAIGIVGDSGAGKTTAVDIMLGLILPQSGQVLVDGRDISDNTRAWHENIGYIPQMIFMLDGSIRDNVVFGRQQLKEDDGIWEALREAALDSFVAGLPDGLDTEIGERGIRLSGGQRQRMGIARALYGNPDVLIFDEATSALDTATESDIMKAIYELKGKRTLIIIAHRLTTIEHCDHVYRVSKGSFIKER